MIIDGIQLPEGSTISNLSVAIGTSFPASPNEGEMFFRSDANVAIKGMYIYSGGVWARLSASNQPVTAPFLVTGISNQISGTNGTNTIVLGASGGTSYVGSVDATPLLLLSGNTEAARVTSLGLTVGIPSTDGLALLSKGIPGFSGELQFFNSSNVKTGVIGPVDGSVMYYQALGGRTHLFLQSVAVTGNLSGTGISGNTGNFSSSVTVGVPSSTGTVQLMQGTGSNTGFIEFFGANAIRAGSIGFSPNAGGTDGGTINYTALNHAFTNTIDSTGLLKAAKGSTNGITIGDVSTNSNAILRLQGTSISNNWQIANNFNYSGLEFTPSTIAGGTAYSIPRMTLAASGLMQITDGSTALLKIFPSGGTVSLLTRNSGDNAYGSALYDAIQHIFLVSGTEAFRLTTSGNATFNGSVSASNLSGTNTGNQTISLTGDVTGSGTGSFAATLANTAVTPGSYTNTNITVDAKGRITAASNGSSGVSTITLTGDVTGSGSGTFAATLATVNGSPQADTFRKVTVNNKGLVTATSAVSASDITTALTYTPINKAGDSGISGNIIFDNDRYVSGRTVGGTPTRLIGLNTSNVMYIGGIDTTIQETLFLNTGVQRMQIDATGNILIGAQGSSSGLGLFQAQSTTSSIADFSSTFAGQAQIRIRNTTANGAFAYFQNSTTGNTISDGLAIGTDGSNAYISNLENTPLLFTTNGTLRLTIAAAGNVSMTGAVSASNLSGTNTGDQTISLTGDVTGSGTGSFGTTLANTAVTPGSYTNTNITVDSKGRITSASSASSIALATNISGGTTGQIPYQSAASTTAFSSGLTWTNGSSVLTVSNGTTETALLMQASNTLFVKINPAPGLAATNVADLAITAGDTQTTGNAGSLFLAGGSTTGTGAPGNVKISGGGSSNSGGYVRIDTGVTNGGLTERLRILNNGAWSVGTGGTATGTSGQVLTSQGASLAPVWSSAGTGSVTSVSVTTANGISGTVATPTSTPAISLALGAITPTSVTSSGSISAGVFPSTVTAISSFSLTFTATNGIVQGSIRSTSTVAGSNSGDLLYNALNQVMGGTLRTNNINPQVDNNNSCGSAITRWTQVFAANGTINTSDIREKQDIRDISQAERNVAIALKSMMKAFRFKDAVQKKGEGARIHFGVIAQEVQAAFTAEGLDAHRYSLFCYDEWAEQTNPTSDGTTIVIPAGNRYGINYDELLAFIISTL